MARTRVDIPIRWGDLDPYSHVNNVAMMRLLEEARIATFWRRDGDNDQETAILDAGTSGGTLTFVGRHVVEYLAPLDHDDKTARIELWISRVGGASIELDYEVSGREGIVARARTTLVMVDPETRKPRRISAEEREAWAHLVDEPLTLRPL